MFKDRGPINNKEPTLQKLHDEYHSVYRLAESNPNSRPNDSKTGFISPNRKYQIGHEPSTGNDFFYEISQDEKVSPFYIGIHDKKITFIFYPEIQAKYEKELSKIENNPFFVSQSDVYGRQYLNDFPFGQLSPKLQKLTSLLLGEVKKSFSD